MNIKYIAFTLLLFASNSIYTMNTKKRKQDVQQENDMDDLVHSVSTLSLEKKPKTQYNATNGNPLKRKELEAPSNKATDKMEQDTEDISDKSDDEIEQNAKEQKIEQGSYQEDIPLYIKELHKDPLSQHLKVFIQNTKFAL